MKILLPHIVLLYFFNYSLNLNAKNDSITNKQYVKLDLVSVYNSLFDVRKQVRLGIEYERCLNSNLSNTYHLDFGMYDYYKYYKYYDFFNSSSVQPYEESKVRTYGFHFLYGYKWHFNSDKQKRITTFVSFQSDLNYFWKNIYKYSSRTNESSNNNNTQIRIGLGPEAGLSFRIYNKFAFELKTAIFFNTLSWKSDRESKNIKPFKAMWYNNLQSFWIIPRINFCYVFTK